MNYITAKQNVARRRLGGHVLIALSATVVVIGLLKFLYFSLDGGGPLLAPLAQLVKRFVYAIYANTQFLSPIWETAPTPDPKAPLSSSSLAFMLWYVGVFVGASLISSANRITARLRRINEQIEDQLIRESLRAANRRTRTQIEEAISVPQQPIWKELHTLYVAPLVVGLLLLVVGKVLGLA
ncbi:YniB family protein [Methylocaldum sp.]|uniref:YniB family protein n=1 Tax=Methylocaldum sp. TaxID=1969727 RepID=UPI002D37290E|nr:YniB family protein [Methylocaldum sp.]HYE34194.1 YniB family protein [Methylocaldum sp.]